jgi:hypothetical protein
MLSPSVMVGEAVLEGYTASGSLEPPVRLPEYVSSGTMISGAVLTGEADLPAYTASGTMLSGSVFTGEAILSAYVGESNQGNQGEATLPTYTASGVMLSGNVASAASQLPKYEATGVLYESGRIDGEAELPLYTSTGFITTSNLITGDAELMPFTASGVMLSGGVSTGSATIPLYEVDASGYTNNIGTASVTLPLYIGSGVMSSSVAAPVFTGITLNTKTNAVSTYSNGNFNSLCTFNGVVLAATSTGIVALMGDTDQGVNINASLSSGVSDFKSEQMKRVLCGYVGYRAAGNMELTLITDEHHENIYRIEPRQLSTDIHPTRVKFGKGVTGRYTQWKWENKAGADFQLDSLSLDVQQLSRKIG